MEWAEVGIYVAVQLVAGILGGLCYLALFGESFNLTPAKGHTVWQAGVAELLYTFMLCFVVLNTACSKANAGKNQYYGLAIGFVVVAGAYGAGSVSGGCFNPAVAFGVDVSSVHYGVWYCFVYTIFELLGAALAAGAFMVCRPEEREPDSPPLTPRGEHLIEGPENYPTSAKLLSEFLGTYMLVLTVGLNVLGGSAAGAFSIAAALMSMIFALGNCSGAHFNPAVTTACILRGACAAAEGAVYMGVQVVGGICAAFTYSFLMSGATFPLKPAGYQWGQALAAEFVFTFVLAFVVLSVATVKKERVLSQYFGFAIGMCVTVGGCAIGKVSGGSLNPAVSIGISTSHIIGGGGFIPCLFYSAVELAAGAVAAGAFFLTQPSEKQEKDEGTMA